MDFVESRMMEDAQALNFSISKMKVINQNVPIDIPSDYNEKMKESLQWLQANWVIH